MKANILGTIYEIDVKLKVDDTELENCSGYTDFYTKKIVLTDLKKEKKDEPHRNWIVYRNRILRHEIIHAFLYESGLAHSSNDAESWAMNEEMVDYFSIMIPKMNQVFKEAGCLE